MAWCIFGAMAYNSSKHTEKWLKKQLRLNAAVLRREQHRRVVKGLDKTLPKTRTDGRQS